VSSTPRPAPDLSRFIAEKLPLAAVPAVPEIRLHMATPASGLRRMLEASGESGSPYWAYPWAGGVVLARFILDRPDAVAGRRVLDLGSGSGLVAIAAARAGAKGVTAVDTDPNAIAALRLNAAANGVPVETWAHDVTAGPPPDVDVVLAGDVFYEAALAARVTTFLDRCLDAGIAVLVGDPGRAPLPRHRLRLQAEYAVADFGTAAQGGERPAFVFAFRPETVKDQAEAEPQAGA